MTMLGYFPFFFLQSTPYDRNWHKLSDQKQFTIQSFVGSIKRLHGDSMGGIGPTVFSVNFEK